MGRDGANPMELLDQGRNEFITFGGEVTQDEVTSLEQTDNAWTATTAEGRQFPARQVLMAMGTGVATAIAIVQFLLDEAPRCEDSPRHNLRFPRVRHRYHPWWVHDRDRWTSSGVAAGIDMAVAFVSHFFGAPLAEKIAHDLEIQVNSDPEHDPFAV